MYLGHCTADHCLQVRSSNYLLTNKPLSTDQWLTVSLSWRHSVRAWVVLARLVCRTGTTVFKTFSSCALTEWQRPRRNCNHKVLQCRVYKPEICSADGTESLLLFAFVWAFASRHKSTNAELNSSGLCVRCKYEKVAETAWWQHTWW